MSGPHRHTMHATRVAVVATSVVLACYALCALGLSLFVASRLTGEVDSRLHAALVRVGSLDLRPSPPVRGGHQEPGNGDLDDVPVFLWRASVGGRARALTAGAPAIPRRSWGTSPQTITVGATPFRVEAARSGSSWTIAGESIAIVSRAGSALVLPEVLFGILLAVATFVGALVVGLRASAPLDLVRKRQAEFTADASHELRTPLSVVEAEVDLALRRRREPEDYEATLRRISAESRRLRRIVDDLMWLARADSESQQSDGAELADAVSVVTSCVRRFEPVAARQGISLRFASEGRAGAAVQVPAGLLDRLAGVLVDNACKYAGTGGSVSVEVCASPTRVVVRVDDSGPGIPPEQRKAVFDRFHRATTREGGAGLGLAIADAVVRSTGGSWSVVDAPLGGARMEVSWRRVGGTTSHRAGGGQSTGDVERAEAPAEGPPRARPLARSDER